MQRAGASGTLNVRIDDKTYPGANGKGVQAVRGLAFCAESQGCTALVGPSGCGKTTILKIIAGLDRNFDGEISLNGSEADASRIGFVFQEPTLLPWRSLEENVRLAATPEMTDADLDALLDQTEIAEFRDRFPGELSLGLARRASIVRALAAKPHILLLDEPFANLDPRLRLDLRRLLVDIHRLHRTQQLTMVYVTHDLDDALALADRIVVLNQGRIEQAAPPEELYRRPQSAFVATFVGKAAIVSGTIEGTEVRTPLGGFSNPRSDLNETSEIEVVLRPEDIEAGQEGVPAEVAEVLFVGDRYLVRALTSWGPIWTYSATRPVPGDTIAVRVRRGWPLESAGPLAVTE